MLSKGIKYNLRKPDPIAHPIVFDCEVSTIQIKGVTNQVEINSLLLDFPQI